MKKLVVLLVLIGLASCLFAQDQIEYYGDETVEYISPGKRDYRGVIGSIVFNTKCYPKTIWRYKNITRFVEDWVDITMVCNKATAETEIDGVLSVYLCIMRQAQNKDNVRHKYKYEEMEDGSLVCLIE